MSTSGFINLLPSLQAVLRQRAQELRLDAASPPSSFAILDQCLNADQKNPNAEDIVLRGLGFLNALNRNPPSHAALEGIEKALHGPESQRAATDEALISLHEGYLWGAFQRLILENGRKNQKSFVALLQENARLMAAWIFAGDMEPFRVLEEIFEIHGAVLTYGTYLSDRGSFQYRRLEAECLADGDFSSIEWLFENGAALQGEMKRLLEAFVKEHRISEAKQEGGKAFPWSKNVRFYLGPEMKARIVCAAARRKNKDYAYDAANAVLRSRDRLDNITVFERKGASFLPSDVYWLVGRSTFYQTAISARRIPDLFNYASLERECETGRFLSVRKYHELLRSLLEPFFEEAEKPQFSRDQKIILLRVSPDVVIHALQEGDTDYPRRFIGDFARNLRETTEATRSFLEGKKRTEGSLKDVLLSALCRGAQKGGFGILPKPRDTYYGTSPVLSTDHAAAFLSKYPDSSPPAHCPR